MAATNQIKLFTLKNLSVLNEIFWKIIIYKYDILKIMIPQ